MLKKDWPVIVVGAGLAGLTSAIHLSKLGVKVAVIEKEDFPKHKVCGEYISNEVLPYLKSLGFNPFDHGATAINRLQVVLASGSTIERPMNMGGFGLSRYTLDAALLHLAQSLGVTLIKGQVSNILYNQQGFALHLMDGTELSAVQIIAAYGKRSILDKKLERPFFNKSAPYLAVKMHYRGSFPADLVGLYNFKGGYCGISCIEAAKVNCCYIVGYDSFKKHNNIDQFEKMVLYKNPVLREILSSLEPVFEKPLTISQISFLQKPSVQDHIIFAGDAAGLIHPLCGNGMSMAIESAQLAANLVFRFIEQSITREQLEAKYTNQWNKHFKSRLNTGHHVSRIMQHPLLSTLAYTGLKTAPFVLNSIVKRTHGQPLKPFEV